MQGTQVWSLVRELRSHMPHGAARRELWFLTEMGFDARCDSVKSGGLSVELETGKRWQGPGCVCVRVRVCACVRVLAYVRRSIHINWFGKFCISSKFIIKLFPPLSMFPSAPRPQEVVFFFFFFFKKLEILVFILSFSLRSLLGVLIWVSWWFRW